MATDIKRDEAEHDDEADIECLQHKPFAEAEEIGQNRYECFGIAAAIERIRHFASDKWNLLTEVDQFVDRDRDRDSPGSNEHRQSAA